MEINGVTIQMLPAASGDCIYLEFPDSDFLDNKFNIIIPSFKSFIGVNFNSVLICLNFTAFSDFFL